MKGLPKWFNSKQDFLNCLADPELKEGAKAKLRELLDARMAWLNKGVLADDDAGVTDDTHKVVEQEAQDGSEKPVRLQYAFEKDPKARLFALGFTVKEAQKLLEE